MDEVQSILSQIIKGIVSKPEEVVLHATNDKDDKGDIVIINIKLNKTDIGVCIGKGGENAEAIRRIIGLIGFKLTGTRVYVKIDAPQIPKNHFNYENE